MRTGSSVFNQGIIHGDTLRGSDWDAQIIPKWCPGVLWYPPNTDKILKIGDQYPNIPQVEDKSLEDIK
jgi:hypothetical protein